VSQSEERRSGIFAGRLSRTGVLLTLVGLLELAVFLSIFIGSREVPAVTVFDVFFNYDPRNADHLVVRGLRVPRTFIGLGVGAALAVAGCVSQGITRNPLGSPSILGINAGAAFAVVFAIFTLGLISPLGYIWFAFLGGAVAAVVTYALGSAGPGGTSPVRLALAGTVVGAMLSAWTTVMLLLSQRTLDDARFWLAGSLARASFDGVWIAAVTIPLGMLLAFSLAPALNTMALGDDLAASLGLRLQRVRIKAAAAVVLLAGSAVALAGPIAFVGLAAPHIVRGIIGSDHRWTMPASLLAGAALLLFADVIGRVTARPGELEVGIVMGIVGAPFLVAIARRAGERAA
jgi:iron complex transport system permease protein